jgi:hypothetical protein
MVSGAAGMLAAYPGPRPVGMQWTLPLLIAAATLGSATADAPATLPATPGSPTVVAPADHPCPGAARVVVRAIVASDARTVCEGVDRALTFLARAGLAAPAGTRIEVVGQLPGELAGRAIGCYLIETRTILLLDYEAFEALGTWFRMPVDRELYRAAAAHEMAHAVVGCHASPGRLPTAAHEYVAYVAMFATMDPAVRTRLLGKFQGRGFSSTLQINDITHIADPNQFAVDAWRHYLGRRDRAAWLREVVAGNVVQEFPKDGP